jgi:hypothetical protein
MTGKTWLWLLGGVAALCVLGLVALAGAGFYFVSRHVDTERTTTSDALRAFDAARAPFEDASPLIEIDALDRPHATRPIDTLPSSPTTPEDLHLLAWSTREERLVRIRLPLWMLRYGRQKIDFLNRTQDLDLEELQIDFAQLERIGPALVLDHRPPSGDRVLIWTQ